MHEISIGLTVQQGQVRARLARLGLVIFVGLVSPVTYAGKYGGKYGGPYEIRFRLTDPAPSGGLGEYC